MNILSDKEVRRILTDNGCDMTKVVVLAIRGAELQMGKSKEDNDRRIWDDRVYICTPDGIKSFEHNTDPNGYREGRGTGANKGMAMLAPGIHWFGKGLHKGRPGYRQCEVFTVIRDGNPPYRDTGWHAIDWHDGGEGDVGATSSLGCQTNRPSVFRILKPYLDKQLDKYDNPMRPNDRGEVVRSFDYVLLPETWRKKGSWVVSLRYLQK